MTFDDIMERVRENTKPKRIAVAVAEDAEVLCAVAQTQKLGLATPVLVGDLGRIRAVAEDEHIDLADMAIVDEADTAEAVKAAVSMVNRGEADVLMKGLLNTADLLRGVLNKEWGLSDGGMLSHVALLESDRYDRMLFITDAAMVMYPDVEAKAQLIKNAVDMMHVFGIECPKVACIAAVEKVNPKMQATLDAAELAQRNRRGEITGCIVDGPFAVDNALDEEAARHKGVESPVAGKADLLLMPNIEAGNVFYKTATFLSDAKLAGLITGARAPIVLTSRSDSAAAKVRAIAAALLAAK